MAPLAAGSQTDVSADCKSTEAELQTPGLAKPKTA